MDIVSLIVFGLFILVCLGGMVLLNALVGDRSAERENRRRPSVYHQGGGIPGGGTS